MATKKAYGPFHLYEEKFDWRGRLLSTKHSTEEVYVQVTDCNAPTILTTGQPRGMFGLSSNSSNGFGLKPKVSLDKAIPMMGTRCHRVPMEGKKELRIQRGFVGSSFVDVYLGSNMVLLCFENEEQSAMSKDLVIWIPDFFKKIRLSQSLHSITTSSSSCLLNHCNSDVVSSAVKKSNSFHPSSSSSAALALQQLQRLKHALVGDVFPNPRSKAQPSSSILSKGQEEKSDYLNDENREFNTSNAVKPQKTHAAQSQQPTRGLLPPFGGNSQLQEGNCPLHSDGLVSTATDVYDILFDALDNSKLSTVAEEEPDESSVDIFCDNNRTALDNHKQDFASSPEIGHTKRRFGNVREVSGFTPELKRSATVAEDNTLDALFAVVDHTRGSPLKSHDGIKKMSRLASIRSPETATANNQSKIDSHFKRVHAKVNRDHDKKSSLSSSDDHETSMQHDKAKRMLSFGSDVSSMNLLASKANLNVSDVASSSSRHQDQQQKVQSLVRNLSADSSFVKEYHFSEQQHAIIAACVERGESIFYTGGGGTGKSILLKRLVELLVTKHGQSKVFVTATTGLAACAIGGTTLHQFLSLPALDENDSLDTWTQALEKTCLKKHIAMRCRQAHVLIIDEVSMLGPRLFELLDGVLKRIRGCSSEPMGGLQLICCGDFLQLPPIRSNNSAAGGPMAAYVTNKDSRRYCFQSSIWNQVFPWNRCYELDHVYRQEGDSVFIEMLNDIRKGIVSETTTQCLRQCVGKKLEERFGILPTVIFTHKKDVDQMNQQRLESLHGESYVYTAKDSADDSTALKTLQSSCPAKDKLTLKIGAQVILVKTLNVSMGLVNGARGVVVRIIKESRAPVVKFFDGQEHVIGVESFSLSIGGHVAAQRNQIPLDLAWAISVHKSQGMTVDQAELHLKNTFECGQAYVALSRVRSRDGLSLKYLIGTQQIKADPIVLQFYAALKQQSTFLRHHTQTVSLKSKISIDKTK